MRYRIRQHQVGPTGSIRHAIARVLWQGRSGWEGWRGATTSAWALLALAHCGDEGAEALPNDAACSGYSAQLFAENPGLEKPCSIATEQCASGLTCVETSRGADASSIACRTRIVHLRKDAEPSSTIPNPFCSLTIAG